MEEVLVTLTLRRLASLQDTQFSPHIVQPVLGVKTKICYGSVYEWLFVVG